MSGWTLGSMQDGTPTVWDGINRQVAVLAKIDPGYDTRLGSPNTPEGQAANARLIAAAPDLLAACKELLAGNWGEIGEDNARAAIAKAECGGVGPDLCRLACAECKRPVCTGAKTLKGVRA